MAFDKALKERGRLGVVSSSLLSTAAPNSAGIYGLRLNRQTALAQSDSITLEIFCSLFVCVCVCEEQEAGTKGLESVFIFFKLQVPSLWPLSLALQSLVNWDCALKPKPQPVSPSFFFSDREQLTAWFLGFLLSQRKCQTSVRRVAARS